MKKILSMRWMGESRLLRRYLLGELPESRLAGLEDELLADEDLFERLLMAEDDLIDGYVRGELSESRRRSFEARFLSSRTRRARVDLARQLMTRAAEAAAVSASTDESRPPWWVVVHGGLAGRTVAAVALAASLIAGGWFLLPQALRDGRVESILPAVSLALFPAVRSEAAAVPELELTDEARAVELEIYVEAEEHYKRFRAHLESGRGERLWSSEDVESRAGSSTLDLKLPADLLRSTADRARGARYVMKIEGQGLDNRFEPLDEYEFMVVRIP